MSSNEWDDRRGGEAADVGSADGWLDETAEPSRSRPFADPAVEQVREPDFDEPPHRPLSARPRPKRAPQTLDEQREAAAPDPESTVDGKPMALFSHLSVVIGWPLFLIPLIQRRNAFSLHHAKAAACIYVVFYGLLVACLISWSFFFPLVMLAYIPGIIAIVKAARGEAAGKWGLGELGEWAFGALKIEN